MLTRRNAILLSGAFGLSMSNQAFAQSNQYITITNIQKWDIFEKAFVYKSKANPFTDINFYAIFSNGKSQVKVNGFFDGDDKYIIRFSPDKSGTWTYKTTSNIKSLNGLMGSFSATNPDKNNHGPVQVANEYHFAYADGTRFQQIGTTCYSWAQQSDEKVSQTIATLKNSPYNKMRMCLFNNVEAEPILPFKKTGNGDKDFDYKQLNVKYFQIFEDRIKRLLEIGVEADIIIFHPYDEKRGFSDMTKENDLILLKYIIARYSAYRNVWWSAANEYDLIKTKTMQDWDNILKYIQKNDPHNRLRSIHNIKILYDNNKPWITHSSIQNGSAVLDDRTAETYRSVYKKPVIFDEVCYEGDIPLRWGDLTGQELVKRFWHGLIGGTYVGHSETFTKDNSGADKSWLGKGGTLLGTSTPRLQFLKTIMENGPKTGINPIDKWWERHIAGKEGEYYLKYFGDTVIDKWEFSLPKNGIIGGEKFKIEIIDTWNMTITPIDKVFTLEKKDNYNFYDSKNPIVNLPNLPYQALRIIRV